MMKEIIISSSILSADFSHLADQIHEAEAGGVNWIHVDVMDGRFVPNITMGPFVVETVRRITRLPLDVHLMIEQPELHIESFARAGATNLSIHIENTPHVYRTIEHIKSLGCNAGIVLNPGTPADRIAEVLPIIDHVLVMTVNPGYSGQEFIPDMVKKVSRVRQMLAELGITAMIEVDGGITADTLPLVYEAGARLIVSATAIFKYPGGISAGIAALRRAVA
jgi:ribulose-phosphate 3-epimerase